MCVCIHGYRQVDKVALESGAILPNRESAETLVRIYNAGSTVEKDRERESVGGLRADRPTVQPFLWLVWGRWNCRFSRDIVQRNTVYRILF